MKLNKKWMIAAAIAAVSASGAANADPTVWTDVVDFKPDKLVVAFDPVVYSHTLENFTVGADHISSYSLKFDLYDDRDHSQEIALFSQPGELLSEAWFNLSGTEWGGWSMLGRWQLNETGSLTVAITSLAGDFYLGGSVLTAYGDRRSSVAEPGTLALFGAALLGFGLMRRKKHVP